MIRRAVPSDLARLLEIEEHCFDPDLYSRMNARQFRAHIASQKTVLKVHAADGSPSGYTLSLLHQGRPWLRFYSLAVDPAAQGGDVGRALFDDVEAEARSRGLGVLCEVRSDNAKLRARYLKLGYEPYREVADYYPDGCSCIKFRKRFADII